jgi:hypothetical protein
MVVDRSVDMRRHQLWTRIAQLAIVFVGIAASQFTQTFGILLNKTMEA